jgi:hypothetical protein
MVNIKVIIAIIASCFSICQAFIMGHNFIRLNTANITIQARVAIGRWYRSGVRYKRVIITTTPLTTEENHVLAHHLRFTAVFEKLQATPYPPNKLDDILASHCHMSSLFAETLCFVLYQTNFATDIDSVNQMRPITMAYSHSLESTSKLRRFV